MGIFKSTQTKSSGKFGSRHCKSAQNGGKPDNAVGFVDEGSPLKSPRFPGELDAELAALGVTDEEWTGVLETLREAYGKTGFDKKAFKAAIEGLNDSLFTAKGCVATYAEFGMGQKAMTVYKKEVWDGFPE